MIHVSKHIFGKKSNGALGNVICVSIRKFRFLVYRRGFSETPRAFRKRPGRLLQDVFGNALSVFNAFSLRFRAFGNALSVSNAFPLRFLFWGCQETLRAFPKRLFFVCFRTLVCEAAFPKRFRCVCFFFVFPPNVFNAFPTTFPETFPMRFLLPSETH